MTTPWAIMDQLHTWASTLQDHIDKLKLNPEAFVEQQQKSEFKFFNRKGNGT